jgi:signal transduction histidine kinase/HAMP domain-containing protein
VAHRPRGIGNAVKTFSLSRLNIGPRLTLCFVFIILAMLAGNAVLLWQFDRARAQAERLSAVDQKFIAVLQAHLNLVSFHEKLDALARADGSPLPVSELEAFHREIVESSRRSKDALSRLPTETQSDAASLPTLIAIQQILPAQLEAVTALAKSGDWRAVRLRLTNQVRPLQALSSSLVDALDREVGDERSQIIANIGRAQRRILLIVPLTAGIILVFAAAFGIAITRSITQPLSRLMDASKALGRSEFHHRISIAGRDELAHLAQVFNETAATLRDLYQALFTRGAYLSEAQRLSHTGSFGWNLYDGELVWSDETFRIFDCDPSVNPTLELVLRRTHPDDVALVRQLIDRVSHGGTDWDLEHRLLMPDGSTKYVRAVAHAVRDPSGQLRFVGAVVDLTPSKRAEEALNRARAELAHVSRVTTLSALTASIAHEVNQPLAGIITNAGTCLRMLDAVPPNIEGARETARRTIRDGNRAADVITRLRALFSKREFMLEPLDLNEATREVIALSANDLHRNRVILQSEFASDLPMIVGDRIQLQQVILNLLRNGSDAMVDVHDRPRHLRIRTEREDGDRVRLTVSDAGVGLPAQSIDSLFDAFYTTKSGGMGIGLFVSRSIVERHQGRLWAEPNVGPGATFSVSVPCDHAGVADAPPALRSA